MEKFKDYSISFNWNEPNPQKFIEHQFLKIKRVVDLIDVPNLIFDCGANIGIYSLFFGHYYPNAKIHGFEILKETCDLANENVKINPNIKIHNMGLWGFKGEVEFGMPESAVQSTNYGAWWQNAKGSGCVHEVDTLDTFAIENNLVPDFIKLDVEGSERMVLQGAAQILPSVKTIMIEYRKTSKSIHSKLPDPNIVDKMLRDAGFELLETLDKFDKIYINQK